MRKLLVIMASAFLLSCGGGETKGTTEEKKDATAATDGPGNFPAGITQADYDKGLQLIANSDCLSCHKINELHTGPAYVDIAKKYEVTDENITMLAGKIIEGGSGNWGSVPMTPHDSVSLDDAKTMVKYVLSLKNMK